MLIGRICSVTQSIRATTYLATIRRSHPCDMIDWRRSSSIPERRLPLSSMPLPRSRTKLAGSRHSLSEPTRYPPGSSVKHTRILLPRIGWADHAPSDYSWTAVHPAECGTTKPEHHTIASGGTKPLFNPEAAAIRCSTVSLEPAVLPLMTNSHY